MNEKLTQELKDLLQVPLSYGREGFDLNDRAKAAVLILFHGKTFLESEVLLILRSTTVTLNPGQVAFPGGGAEESDGGDPAKTAVRECFEEVGVSPDNIQTLGVLPFVPTVTGHVMVAPVIGVYTGERLPLTLQLEEVSRAEWVSVASLLNSQSSEKRMVHGVEIELPVFAWTSERMWGLSALIFDLILSRYGKLLA